MAAFDPRDRAEVKAAQGNAGYGGGGRDFNGGRSNGPQGTYNPRYTRTPTRVYDASLENLAKLATRVAPGPGLISGAVMDITGMRPGFSGYQGMGNGYSYDNKGMTPLGGGNEMAGPGTGWMSRSVAPRPTVRPVQPQTRGPSTAPGSTMHQRSPAFPGYPQYSPFLPKNNWSW